MKGAVVRIISSDAQGSGFVYEGEGLVLTNSHVVGDERSVIITFADGNEATGSVMGTNDLVDLAVVRIEGSGPFPVVQLGNSEEIAVGDDVIAIGYPLGTVLTGGPTVTRGIVSARRLFEGVSMIQTDALINPGSSGGPLIDSQGTVIGINTAKIEEFYGRPIEGIGLAIPIKTATDLLPLMETETAALPVAPTPTPTPAPTPVPIGEWSTYHNEVYDYFADVAPSWIVSELGEGDVELTSPDQLASVYLFQGVEADTLEGLADETIRFREEEAQALFLLGSQEATTLESGIPAIRIEYREQLSPESCIQETLTYVLLVELQPFELIGTTCISDWNTYDRDITRMLRSFTPSYLLATPTPIPTPSDGQFKVNSEFGYAVEVPQGWGLYDEEDWFWWLSPPGNTAAFVIIGYSDLPVNARLFDSWAQGWIWDWWFEENVDQILVFEPSSRFSVGITTTTREFQGPCTIGKVVTLVSQNNGFIVLRGLDPCTSSDDDTENLDSIEESFLASLR